MLTVAVISLLAQAGSGPVRVVDPPVDWYDYLLLPLLAFIVIGGALWARPKREH